MSQKKHQHTATAKQQPPQQPIKAVEQPQSQDAAAEDNKQKVAIVTEDVVDQHVTPTPEHTPTTTNTGKTTEEIQADIKAKVSDAYNTVRTSKLVTMAINLIITFLTAPIIAHLIESITNIIPSSVFDTKNQIIQHAESLTAQTYDYILVILTVIAAPQTAVSYAQDLVTTVPSKALEFGRKIQNAAIAKKDEAWQFSQDQFHRVKSSVSTQVDTLSSSIKARVAPIQDKAQELVAPYQDRFITPVVNIVAHMVTTTKEVYLRIAVPVEPNSLDAKQQQVLFRPRMTTEGLIDYTIAQGVIVKEQFVIPAVRQVFKTKSVNAPQATNP